ncbi:MAG: ABC transporter permease [Acidimicrobiia bacterium]|nr:ABC transporter permease [Acidimicrobiia bacterium]
MTDPPSAVAGPGSSAQIFDQGYRRYTGPRTGMSGSIRSLVKHSLRHALGLGRSARFKVIPLAVVGMAYLPAAVFVGLAALIPVDTEEFLPTYAEYYAFVAATIYLLAGFVGPELLCSDRRTGLLGVYLASPLDRPNYLYGKAISVFAMLLLVTLGPPMLMLIAFSLQNMGPDGFLEWLKVFGQILASSAVIGLLYTAVSLAISATTDRIPVATATILALIPGSAIVTDIMVDEAELTPSLHLLNLLFLPRALIFRIHGERGGWSMVDNPTWTLWLACAAWTLGAVVWIWYRYRTLLVRR